MKRNTLNQKKYKTTGTEKEIAERNSASGGSNNDKWQGKRQKSPWGNGSREQAVQLQGKTKVILQKFKRKLRRWRWISYSVEHFPYLFSFVNLVRDRKKWIALHCVWNVIWLDSVKAQGEAIKNT